MDADEREQTRENLGNGNPLRWVSSEGLWFINTLTYSRAAGWATLDWSNSGANVGGVLWTATLAVNRNRVSPRGARLPRS